jgi:hypothetical protein
MKSQFDGVSVLNSHAKDWLAIDRHELFSNYRNHLFSFAEDTASISRIYRTLKYWQTRKCLKSRKVVESSESI